MVKMLSKLELMLGIGQMNLTSVSTWFPKEKRQEIIDAINNSPKFKLEHGIVSLKSETEIYEEVLEKDILKDLTGELGEIRDILDEEDEFESFGDDLELIECVVLKAEDIQDAEPVKEPINVNKLDGSKLSYETMLRLINEYNKSVEDRLNYAVENRYEVREKAIKTFYKNKYNVRIKEEGIINTSANIYGLVNRKKWIEVAYLVICDILSDSILNYILDNYNEEVVYFCPIGGVDVDFEVGLNEFYLKDTDIRFDIM